MLLLQKRHCVRMLIALRVVTDVADPYQAGSNYPSVAEILPAFNELSTNFALQLGYHLFRTFFLDVTVKP